MGQPDQTLRRNRETISRRKLKIFKIAQAKVFSYMVKFITPHTSKPHLACRANLSQNDQIFIGFENEPLREPRGFEIFTKTKNENFQI